MGIKELKEKLHKQIDASDEIKLQTIASIIESVENSVVSYDVLGNALSINEYNKMIDEAERDVKQGRFMTQEALEQKIISWSNE